MGDQSHTFPVRVAGAELSGKVPSTHEDPGSTPSNAKFKNEKKNSEIHKADLKVFNSDSLLGRTPGEVSGHLRPPCGELSGRSVWMPGFHSAFSHTVDCRDLGNTEGEPGLPCAPPC